MIPYIPLYPNCLALRFKIYNASLTDTTSLEGVAGYCLVIFQRSKLYYLKRTVNLKNYLSNLQKSLEFNNKELPQCVENILNRHPGDKPVTYYLEDSNPQTLYQIHNMLSPVGWVNIITPRGERTKPMRELCFVTFNRGMYGLISCRDESEYDDLKKSALSNLSSRLLLMRGGPRLTHRLRTQFDALDLITFLDKLRVIDIVKTNITIPLSKVAPIIKAYNDDMVLSWINAPAWAWDHPLEVKDIQSYVDKYVKETRHVNNP